MHWEPDSVLFFTKMLAHWLSSVALSPFITPNWRHTSVN
jgi:hypothetical protein